MAFYQGAFIQNNVDSVNTIYSGIDNVDYYLTCQDINDLQRENNGNLILNQCV